MLRELGERLGLELVELLLADGAGVEHRLGLAGRISRYGRALLRLLCACGRFAQAAELARALRSAAPVGGGLPLLASPEAGVARALAGVGVAWARVRGASQGAGRRQY
jgi:hypothetical protein